MKTFEALKAMNTWKFTKIVEQKHGCKAYTMSKDFDKFSNPINS